jgi:hypothetical protein
MGIGELMKIGDKVRLSPKTRRALCRGSLIDRDFLTNYKDAIFEVSGIDLSLYADCGGCVFVKDGSMVFYYTSLVVC